MTFKNAAADLPHGGGKSVLYGDPAMPKDQKEGLVRAFACALEEIEQYIFGPDMGTDEECMAWVRDEIGRAVGLPAEIGGIPLDEIGATGWGLLHAVKVACEFQQRELAGARVAVQGFGAVGKHAARFLGAEGAVIVAAADKKGTVSCAEGLDVAKLRALKEEGGSVIDYPDGPDVSKGNADSIIDVECDIWIPAAPTGCYPRGQCGSTQHRHGGIRCQYPHDCRRGKDPARAGGSLHPRISLPMPAASYAPRWNTRVPVRPQP